MDDGRARAQALAGNALIHGNAAYRQSDVADAGARKKGSGHTGLGADACLLQSQPTNSQSGETGRLIPLSMLGFGHW